MTFRLTVSKIKEQKLVFFLTLFLFLGKLNYGQELIKKYENLIEENRIQTKYDSLIAIGIDDKKYSEISQITHDISIKYYLQQDYARAIKYSRIEVECLEKQNINGLEYSNAKYNLGYFLSLNEEYDKSNEVYIDIVNDNLDKHKVARSYGMIGQNHSQRGAFKKAIDYLNKSIKQLEDLKDYRNLVTQKIYLANVYLNFKDSISALKGISIGNDLSDILSYLDSDFRLSESVNKVYANAYSMLGASGFIKARDYLSTNLYINKTIKDSIRLGGVYSSLSYLYNSNEKDSAGFFALKAIALTRNNLTKNSIAYGNYIEFLLKNKRYIIANQYLDTIIELNLSSKNISSELGTVNTISNKLDVLDFFHQKLQALNGIYLSNKNLNKLVEIEQYSKKSDYLTQILEESISDYSTKLYWRQRASQAYLYGAYAAHLLDNSEQAFEFMEKNKALLLSESVLKNTEFANLPKHISDEETRRKRTIYNLESQLSKDSKNTVLQDSLFVAKRSHEKFVDSLKTVFPKYFARKINVEQIPLNDMRQELSKDEAIVSFIWNDFDRDKELVVGLVATKDSTKTFLIENVDELKTDLSKYQEFISEPFATKQDQIEFQKVAYKLYQQLLPSKEIQEMISTKDIMIIADGQLQNIPFESLITKENSMEYLILQSDIHYSYSYSFLKHNDKVKRDSENAFIGYSPITFKDSVLANLTNSEEEIVSIQSKINGEIKLKDSATKADFLANSSDTKIIHLATHADAGDNPWIAFADEKLELHELYTYKNKAELVTLSACNTSLGEMAKGEGVISLARGFFHSGSESVVSSLWKVNDKASSEIMNTFYNNLLQGQSKTKALSNAKRTFLKNHSLSEQSPYYWSSFVLIGDSEEIDMNSNNYLLYGLLLLIIPVGFIFRKKFKKVG